MPELPEAETIVRGLRTQVEGARVVGVEVLRQDVVEGDAGAFARGLAGLEIARVGRRGKNVILTLSDGARLAVNLGMSGRLLLRRSQEASPFPTHPAVLFRLDAIGLLVYHDVRRFGRLRLLSPAAFRRWTRSLGPEPLGREFTARELERRMGGSSAPVRSWLLDQRNVAGIGNIYANEALHLAGLHPRRRAGTIAGAEATRLHRAIRRVLREAVRSRGTTLRDYRTAGGESGSYSGRLRVYGRDDLPCPRCRTPVERTVFANRSAFFCPRCQPLVDPDRP